MNESEIKIIADRVLEELRRNSKTIKQLQNITSISDADLFEIDGGRNVSFMQIREHILKNIPVTQGEILLTKGLNDYSELDSYGNFSSLGRWAVYQGKKPNLIGFLDVYRSWGGTIVQDLVSFMTSNGISSTAMDNTTRMVRSKRSAEDIQWSDWTPYQASFIGCNRAGGGSLFVDDYMAPSLTDFKNSVIRNAVSWSGTILENASIQQNSASENNPENIVFVKSENRFAYKLDEMYVDNWHGRDKYLTDERKLTNNYFVSLIGETWVADTENGLSKLSQRFYNVKSVRDISEGTIDAQNYFGDASEFLNAVRYGRLIMSDGIMMHSLKCDYNHDGISNVELLFIKGVSVIGKQIEYMHIFLTIIRGNVWSDSSVTKITIGG